MEICTFCETADKRLGEFIKSKKDLETSFNRKPQQSVKCGFGLQGICCRLCANGPCRITPTQKRGVCGADADTIVARNFLRAVAAGAGCYLHVVENVANNLKKMAENQINMPFKGQKTLHALADKLGIHGQDDREIALQLAEKVISDLYKPRWQEMELVKYMAPAMRYKKWSELGILPGGAKSEVFDAVVKTSTNLSSDPVDMLMHVLRLGIATGLYGLALTNKLNDIIMGEPVLRSAPVGFRVIDPDYINIMPTGHQQSLFWALLKRLNDEDVKKMAQDAGAKGFRIIGCTCVGQDFQLRGEHAKDVYAGHVGNNFTSEAVLATGAIDLVVSEFNCTIPGLETVAERYMVRQICIDDVAKKANADLVQYTPEEAMKIADRILKEAVDSYKFRRGKVNIDIPYDHGYESSLTGVSEGSLKEFLGGSYKPLIDLIASGRVKGIAAIVGCSNLTSIGHDIFTVELTKELIKRDILVLSAGCTSGGLENCGLMSKGAEELAGDRLKEVCRELNIPPVLNFGPCLAIGRLEIVAAELAEILNVDIPQLPLVLSAPQWLEEQALADGAFGLALGLPLHLSIPPFITGSKLVTEILTEKLQDITGGRLIINNDVKSSADELEGIILQRRKDMGI
ncbi:anaerobic carbon-monoxide dehydrogenase catalytic subunit [Anaerocellum danielii]|uniref:Carbon monoxide dehydrogenase n=1 Tax=Anaerocellum danielii TaxID=1387557 RepID=A0ABZ0U248_9FIRM|nr:anaerobic carbon-monoxide dehydrogenase catalytic subunit [Caldicellulosiruptor danielii]WPX08683.1 anaerobic carbon-monoxide dehydrogenase catalytic subunit [Caldicellulosiruptor danielii]